MRLVIPEVFQQVTDANTLEEKIAILKKNDNPTIRQILSINFNPTIIVDLPAGQPPYKASHNPLGLTETNLYAEAKRLYLIIKGHPKRPAGLKRLQQENIFVQILEGVHATEAQLMILMKDKKIQSVYTGVTEAVVRAAYPDLLPATEVPEKQAEIVKRPVGRPRKVEA